MKFRKGQAALEFLTTYGWAFMIILVMIGALAYFGVLDSKVVDSCTVSPGFSCPEGDYQIATGDVGLQAKIINNLGKTIVIDTVTVVTAGEAATCTISDVDYAGAIATSYPSDRAIFLDCAKETTDTIGSPSKYNFEFNYTVNGGAFAKIAEGTIVYNVNN